MYNVEIIQDRPTETYSKYLSSTLARPEGFGEDLKVVV